MNEEAKAANSKLMSEQEAHERYRANYLTEMDGIALYRSLAVLEAAGVVRRHHDPSGLIRFELSEWLSGHHHHLLCADCGVVEDVELDDVSERTLSNLARRFGRRAGYEVAGHGLEIVGVCRDCIPA